MVRYLPGSPTFRRRTSIVSSGWERARRSGVSFRTSDLATYLAVFSIVAALCWLRARGTYGPSLLPDELGPIEYARFVAGENAHARLQYYPGAGLAVIGPVVLGDSPIAEYRLVLAQQAVLLGIHAALVVAIFRLLVPTRPRWEATALGVAVGVLGATVVASVLIWSEATVLVTTSAIALAVVVAVQRRSVPIAIVAAGAAGLSIVLHPRLVVVAAAACAALCLTNGRVWGRARVAAIVVSTVAGLFVGRRVVSVLQHHAGSEPYEVVPGDASVADRVFSNVMILGGQVVVATIATAGLVWFAIPRLRRERPDVDALRVFLVVALVGFAVLTALRFEPPIHRSDIFYYSRYASPAYPLAIVAALVGRDWYASNRVALLRRSMAAVAVVALIGAYEIWRITPVEQAQTFVMAMSPELAWMVERTGRVVPVAVAGLAVAAIGVGAVIAGARTRWAIAGATVAVLLMAAAAQTRPGHVEGASSERAWVIVDELATLPQHECVGFDLTGTEHWYRNLYEFYLPNDIRTVRLSSGHPCGDFVIAARDVRRIVPGAELVRRELRGGLALYRMP